jgi:hypothetical protein
MYSVPLHHAERGRLKCTLLLGSTEKTLIVGDSLGDGGWHSVSIRRRGMTVTMAVDGHTPLVGQYT